MIDKKYLFKKTEKIRLTLTRQWIQEYAEAIGDYEPIYFDKMAAQKRGFSDVVAPVTMPVIFWQYFDIPWLKHLPVIIHGKQSFQYNEPLIAGRTYECVIQLVSLKNKNRKNGTMMQIADHELTVSQEKKICAVSYTTLIIMEEENEPFS